MRWGRSIRTWLLRLKTYTTSI